MTALTPHNYARVAAHENREQQPCLFAVGDIVLNNGYEGEITEIHGANHCAVNYRIGAMNVLGWTEPINLTLAPELKQRGLWTYD